MQQEKLKTALHTWHLQNTTLNRTSYTLLSLSINCSFYFNCASYAPSLFICQGHAQTLHFSNAMALFGCGVICGQNPGRFQLGCPETLAADMVHCTCRCQELFDEMSDMLPMPDFLITSVGTKVRRALLLLTLVWNMASSTPVDRLLMSRRVSRCYQRETLLMIFVPDPAVSGVLTSSLSTPVWSSLFEEGVQYVANSGT